MNNQFSNRSLFISFAWMLLMPASMLLAQENETEDYSGIWAYEIKNTPYGDFSGTITLTKKDDKLEGKIHNAEGKEFEFKILRLRGNRMTFTSNVEDVTSTFSGFFDGDVFTANGEVVGDDFTYKMVARRQSRSKSD